MGFLDAVRQEFGTATPTPAQPLATVRQLLNLDGATAYALAALNRECSAVATAPEGTRNHALNRAAFNLAQLVAGGELPPATVQEELTAAGSAAGLDLKEITQTLNSGLRAGEHHPRQKPEQARRDEWLSALPARPIHPSTWPTSAGTANLDPWETSTATTPATTSTTNPPQSQDPAPSPQSPHDTPHNQTPNPSPFSTGSPDSPTLSTQPTTPSPNSSTPDGPQATPTPNGSANTWPASTSHTQPDTSQTSAPERTPEQARQEFFNREVALEVLKQQVREQAARQIQKDRNAGNRPEIIGLPEFLATPDEDASYRMTGLWPTGGRVMFAAQYKAGKSTTVGNALRALADGTEFLNQFPTEKAHKIVLIDNELDPRTLRRWLRDQEIQNPQAITLIPLRGKVGAFDILDPATRQEWAQAIHGADVVIMDCLRPVLDALGLSEDKDAGRFLVAFDTMLSEAGASEALIVHHMGHNGERSRGDSRILDWPDATWRILRADPEDPASPRFFSAFGRDVDVPESGLTFDAETRHLTMTGGTRKTIAAADLVPAVVEAVTMNPNISGRGIENLVQGQAAAVRQAVAAAVTTGAILKLKSSRRGGGFEYVAR